MNEPIFNKIVLGSAIILSLASVNAYAVVPDQLLVNNMLFTSNGQIFNTGGQFNLAGTVGPFDPAVDLVDDGGVPPIRSLAPGFNQATASGNIFSFNPFFGIPWLGVQQSGYLKNTDSMAFVYDKNNSPVGDPCSAPASVTKSTGPCSSQGSYDFDTTLAAMTDEQIAVGIFFNWSVNANIAVLEIFDCDATGNCTGNGVPMANGPFTGQVVVFNAGLSCGDAFAVTDVNTPVSIDIAKEILGNDPDSIANDPNNAANCANPTAVTQKNPEGLTLQSVSNNTAGGGTAVINGTVVDYTPPPASQGIDFQGADSFTFSVTDDTGQQTTSTVDIQVGGELQSNFSMLDKTGNIFGGTNDVDIVWDETFNASIFDGNGILTDTDFDGPMTVHSDEPFFNFNWNAHHVRIFKNETAAPVTYKFDVTCTSADYDAGIVDCNNDPKIQGAVTQYMTMILQPGQIGGHLLFNWGKVSTTSTCGVANCDIDVVNYWRENAQWEDADGQSPDVPGSSFKNDLWLGKAGVPPAADANWRLVSSDVSDVNSPDGDGLNASPMLDGAFVGSYSNFNFKPDKSGKPTPPFTGSIGSPGLGRFGAFSLWGLLASMGVLLGFRRFNKK